MCADWTGYNCWKHSCHGVTFSAAGANPVKWKNITIVLVKDREVTQHFIISLIRRYCCSSGTAHFSLTCSVHTILWCTYLLLISYFTAPTFLQLSVLRNHKIILINCLHPNITGVTGFCLEMNIVYTKYKSWRHNES
jgi:hypothetical protein